MSDLLADADALLAAGKADQAVQLLGTRIAEGRGGILARLALGRAQMAAGRPEDAAETLREAAALAPGIADVAVAQGEVLLALGHLPTAIAELQRALRLDPDCEAARFQLGCAWLEAGEAARARDIFAALDSPEAAEKVRAAEALLAAPRAPGGYVRHLFDQFSADYDSRMLGTLAYQAHRIVRELAGLVLPPNAEALRILDLGCGTGLAGEAFADLARGGRLDGVDLSPRMVEQARARGLYDALQVGEIEALLTEPGPAYDLILAADTLVYLGDLSAVMDGAAARLAPGGFFLFTVERHAGDGFELGPKRRYRHSEAYLRALAAASKLEVMGLIACVPRREAGQPVDGLAAALSAPRK